MYTFPTGGINYQACVTANSSTSFNKCITSREHLATYYSNHQANQGEDMLWGMPIYHTMSYYLYSLNIASDGSVDGAYYPAITFPTGGINYTCCNLGSVNTNSSNGDIFASNTGTTITLTLMHKYADYSHPYTGIPNYNPVGNKITPNSNGAYISSIGYYSGNFAGCGTYYPAILFWWYKLCML